QKTKKKHFLVLNYLQVGFCFPAVSNPVLPLGTNGSFNLNDRLSDCRGETILSVFEGDIRDGNFLRKALRGASTVFHTASLIDVTESVEYNEMYGVNVHGKAFYSKPMKPDFISEQ
ncbi:hypothetical protein ATANTOWER_013537, partial [Ataeniobius toweri]|nr:hypothetical protein [Ataeniobius toweri]